MKGRHGMKRGKRRVKKTASAKRNRGLIAASPMKAPAAKRGTRAY